MPVRTADVHDRPGPLAWAVVVLAAAYFLTPLAASMLEPGRTLPPHVIARMLTGAVVALLAVGQLARHPRAATVVIGLTWLVDPGALGAAMVAQERVSRTVGNPTRVVLGVGGGLLAARTLGMVLDGYDLDASSTYFESTLAFIGIVVASLVGLLRSSQAREAERFAEADAARRDAVAARVNEARLAEREQIAREMHDVVAHRISLIALHAGALAHRPDADPAEASVLVRLIQSNAQASLDELRGMLTSLRGQAPSGEPQPTLAGVDALLAEAGAAGQRVHLQREGDLDAVPQRVSRHAYRIVQEGLTNARRHAPGAPVEAQVVVGTDRVRVRVSNPRVAQAPDASGSRWGLVGVAERVEQVGGELTHGGQGADFVLQATLPFRAGGGKGAP